MWNGHRSKRCVTVTIHVGMALGVLWAWPAEKACCHSSMTGKASMASWVQANEILTAEDNRMNSHSGENHSSSKPAAQESIGEARMLPDGEIVLDLYAVDSKTGARGHTQLRYPPSHPQYDDILEHLGGMQPGEQKPVPPWK